MNKKIAIAILALLISCAGFAQTENNTKVVCYDEILRKKVAENPEVIAKLNAYEEQLKHEIELMKKNKGTKTDTLINGKHIIPVVFHIIHNNGPENISEEQIMTCIELANIDLNMENTDTVLGVNTYEGFSGRRGNPRIELRLARLDPDGNPTSGIIRHESANANSISYTDMPQYAWDATKYLNIFSVGAITVEGMGSGQGTVVGMSLFPPTNPLTAMFTSDPNCDGVLIRHDAIGNIGTATDLVGKGINAQNRSFTHEFGHYMNLYHTFQNLSEDWDMNNQSDQMDMMLTQFMGTGCDTVSYGGTKLYGDYVDDTPPVTAATQDDDQNCKPVGSVNTCTNHIAGYGDEPDMIENYMDYQWGFCANMFTLGQLERINATLDGYRRSLWQYENLIATGVLNYNDIPEQINDSGFELYPNPTNDILNIKSKSINFDNAQVDLYDLSGKLLLHNTLQESTLRIDVSGLASGFYIIKINGKSEKFIKK